MNKKGITVVTVTVIVVVMLILAGTVTTFSYKSIENAKKIVFSLEISSIQEEINKYISNLSEEYNSILGNEYLINLSGVSENSIFQFDGESKSSNNEITVYEINLSSIGITDTTYGNNKTEKDIYVFSKVTGRVYYLEGIKTKNITYYTLTEDLINLNSEAKNDEEQKTSLKPVISAGGFVTKTLSDGTKEIYLTNISVENAPKIFKYELGIISKENAKEYFKSNGKTVTKDRLYFLQETDVTLYAESYDGDYEVIHCIYSSNGSSEDEISVNN